MNQKIIHKRSNVVADGTVKLPTADQLDYGELAINYADGSETITLKNSNNDIVSFKSQEYIDDHDLFTKGTTKSGIVRKNGGKSTAKGLYSFAEGYNVTASGSYSHAEGYSTIASGNYSHAENGYLTTEKQTIAKGNLSHAEGSATQAEGDCSHSEGNLTKATVYASHAEGNATTASGLYSHSEGSATTASGQSSHAEGGETTASGDNSHAEGGLTIASGEYSHAEGIHTTASGHSSHAEGQYNVASTLSIHCVGIGSGKEDGKNAEDIDYGGNKYLIGLGNYDGTNLSVTSGETENINPEIKSVQEILNKLVEKAGGLSALFA